jgi:23S rRNA (guanosine2251-2'-O)-methyltransferase
LTEWIGGRRPVAEALAAGRDAHRLLVSGSAKPSPELKAILAAAREASVQVENVPGDRLARLAGFDGHQGVLLEVGDRRWADLAEMLARAAATPHDPLILVLENLQDPTNFGTLLRSAEAAGVDGVMFPERASAPLSAAAVKASAGASEHLLLARVESLGHTLRDLQAAGLHLVAADQDAPAAAWDTDLRGPLAVVIGSEGEGVSGATRRRMDLLVSFPMAGRVASLNAATAGALLLFEVIRQRTLQLQLPRADVAQR